MEFNVLGTLAISILASMASVLTMFFILMLVLKRGRDTICVHCGQVVTGEQDTHWFYCTKHPANKAYRRLSRNYTRAIDTIANFSASINEQDAKLEAAREVLAEIEWQAKAPNGIRPSLAHIQWLASRGLSGEGIRFRVDQGGAIHSARGDSSPG